MDLFSVKPENIYFIEDSPGNKHSEFDNQSQIISYSPTIFWLVSQLNDLRL